MDRHPEVLARAYRNTLRMSGKIKEYGIRPDMTEAEEDTLVKLFAEAKAERDGGDWKKYVSGQRWYVKSLMSYSGLNAADRLEMSYQEAFPDIASEDEMLNSIEAFITK